MNELTQIRKWIDKGGYFGIGEIGLDFYWDKTFADEQVEAFRIQLKWAMELNLPAIIHVRESFEETIQIVEESGRGNLRGIFHCFTGTTEQAARIIDLGFHLGIGGILTFKNAGLDKTLEDVPLEKIVLETDSPYLAPVPKRGKRNEPAYLPYVANKLAEIKKIDVHQIAEQTSSNARLIFGY
jgi:TatD DNase family protein